MTKINIKPLSVNEAWRGKRFKTEKYKVYERALLHLLPSAVIPKDILFQLDIHFYFSNKASDLDNPVKLIIDIIQKKYDINDKNIYKLTVEKSIVKKGFEAFEFSLYEYKKEV